MARTRTGYAVAAEPPVEGMLPKIRRLVHGTTTEAASVTWLRKHVAEISVTILVCTTLLLIVLQLS